jgi:histidinol-phosphate/aromatic aminotransferase/cobyric acid decarboxylase-like protein
LSIHLIARDLYRLEREVSELERQLAACAASERDEVEDRLRKVRAERNRMRNILEGAKEDPPCRRPR